VRQRFGDLIFGAELHLDEDLAQQLLMAGTLLLFDRAVELFLLNEALVQQDLSERFARRGRTQ
jgi:hypothetical protein